MKPTLVIGDVHGCADELARLLDRHPDVDVLFVGDLFTKGPDPVGVRRLWRERGASTVLGNHDTRLLDVLDGKRPNDRHGAKVVAALDAADPSWRDDLRGSPLYEERHGWTVVHAAIHPSGDLAQTRREDFLLRRRWPETSPDDPFWWQVYRGDRRVIFGHDAMRGLVQVARGGQRLIVGLDTGCVYGGQLTGFLLPDERLDSVEAARAYVSLS